jgi:hypothetical protein
LRSIFAGEWFFPIFSLSPRASIVRCKRSTKSVANFLFSPRRRYAKLHELDRISQANGLVRRDARLHRVVQPAPIRLNLRPGDPGFQEQFDFLMQSPGHGGLRFVEWRGMPGFVEFFCRADAEVMMAKEAEEWGGWNGRTT